MTIVVVVVIVPVAIAVPTMAIFIPPTVAFTPAAFPGLVQFMTPVVCLAAVPAVMFDSLVEFVVGSIDAPLAIIIGHGARSARESHRTGYCGRGECYLSEKLRVSFKQSPHGVPSLLNFPRLGMGGRTRDKTRMCGKYLGRFATQGIQIVYASRKAQ